MKISIIAWVRYDRRPDLLARHLGGTVHFVTHGRRDSLLQAPLRYVVQTAKTWAILRQERPNVVFVQNPPIFCAILAWLYAWCYGARFGIDSHSAAFLSPKWRWSLGLHRLLARRALTTLVSNEHFARIIRGWGCQVTTLGFTPGFYPPGDPFQFDQNDHFQVAVVSTGAEDEPLNVIFEAASHLPDVTFYISGDSGRIAQEVLAKRPSNCHLTGYIPYGQYVGLLRNADVIVDLTTRDNTLLMGAYEAVSLGTPLITSDWPILKSYFSQGVVHVPNTVDGVCAGIRQAQHSLPGLREGIVRLRDQLQAEWDQNFGGLQLLLQATVKSSESTTPMTTHPLTCSVVVITYQRPDTFPMCLQALAQQQRQPDEIVVVARDTDLPTQVILREWVATDPTRHRMAVVSRPGQLVAMEAGVLASKGQIVAFTDDDAQPHPDWLRRMLAYYDDPSVGGVGGRDLLWREGVLLDGRTGRVGYITWYGRVTGDSHLDYPGPQYVVTMKGVNMSFRRQFIEFDHHLLGTPTIWPSDTSITLNAIRRGARLISDSQILVDHHEYTRKQGDERKTVYPEAYLKKSHNITYLVLKYLPWYCWPAFFLYTTLIGQQNTPGIFYDWLHRQKPRWAILTASLRGKLMGFKTYWRWRAQQRQAITTAGAAAGSGS